MCLASCLTLNEILYYIAQGFLSVNKFGGGGRGGRGWLVEKGAKIYIISRDLKIQKYMIYISLYYLMQCHFSFTRRKRVWACHRYGLVREGCVLQWVPGILHGVHPRSRKTLAVSGSSRESVPLQEADSRSSPVQGMRLPHISRQKRARHIQRPSYSAMLCSPLQNGHWRI